jgi:hypothetical protein
LDLRSDFEGRGGVLPSFHGRSVAPDSGLVIGVHAPRGARCSPCSAGERHACDPGSRIPCAPYGRRTRRTRSPTARPAPSATSQGACRPRVA